MVAVEAPFVDRFDLGEGPHWNAATRTLGFVDIDAGEIHDLDPETGDLSTISLLGTVSFVVPVAGTGERICGTQRDLTLLDAEGHPQGRTVAEHGKPDNRINDGKADPAGRLWFGTMNHHRQPEGSLYCFDEGGVNQVFDGVTVSNGMDWDVERRRMYYIDTATRRIDLLDYDVTSGEVGDRRPFIVIDAADGKPDGMTLDAEGCLWVCFFYGGTVRRFDPDGVLVRTIELPVSCPTSAAFGGDDLSSLFVTTSRHKLSDDERREQPMAGAVLVVDAGVRGRAANEVSVAAAEMLCDPDA
jgi:sugar lactone lactonase YvrE